MRCTVVDIRRNSRQKLGKFLIVLYILNIVDLLFTKFLLFKAPDLFKEINIFLKPIINGVEAYFIKMVVMALVLIYWYLRSGKSNITQMKRSLFTINILIGVYIVINILHLINMGIYIWLS